MSRKRFSIIVILVSILLFNVHVYSEYAHKNPKNILEEDNTPLRVYNTAELPVGIFYDEKFSEPWNLNANILTGSLYQSLSAANLSVYVLNSMELKIFMDLNQIAIIIITMGIAPSSIWNGSENSFVKTWLDNGGIIIWTGCQEFYWIGTESGENIPVGNIGAKYVLNMDYIKTLSDLYVMPTSIGLDLFDNFSGHSSDVFSSVSSLEAANVYYEAYAKNGDYADPILFQPRDGKGYFVRIHANWNDQLPINQLSDWISSFIVNRFFKLPIITEIQIAASIFLLSSAELYVNVTNFSNKTKNITITSISDVIEPLNTNITLPPLLKTQSSFVLTLNPTARFQKYSGVIYIYSNFTNSNNEEKLLLIFQKGFEITIQSPIRVQILDITGNLYPGSSNQIRVSIQKYINQNIEMRAILISEGCFNEIKIDLNLLENDSIIEIPFSIQLMTKSGGYKIYLRFFQGNVLLSSLNRSIYVDSILNNPVIIISIVLLAVIAVIVLILYLQAQRRRRVLNNLELKNLKQ